MPGHPFPFQLASDTFTGGATNEGAAMRSIDTII
jgi:hypothetical protein